MRKIHIIYALWLLLLALLLILCSLGYVPYTLFGKSRTLGIVLFLMADLLCLIMLADKGASRLRQLLVFVVVTAVYIYYCYQAKWVLRMDSYRDAIVAGGLFCAAVFLGVGKRLFTGEGTEDD